MLAVDFLEALGRLLVVVLAVHQEQALVIELVRRIVRDDIFLAEETAGRQHGNDQRERREARSRRPLSLTRTFHRERKSPAFGGPSRHRAGPFTQSRLYSPCDYGAKRARTWNVTGSR